MKKFQIFDKTSGSKSKNLTLLKKMSRVGKNILINKISLPILIKKN